MVSRAVATIAVLVVAGCGGKKDAGPAAPTAIPLAIFVDDRQVATRATLGAIPRPLVEVVPGLPAPDTWLAVVVFDAAGGATTAMTPSKNHPDAAAALAVGNDGVVFGFARGDQLDAAVARIVKVVVKTRDDRGAIVAEVAAQGDNHGGGDSGGGGHEGDGHGRPTPTAELTIAITSAAGASVFTGDKLASLPSVTAPVGDTTTLGWNLLDVMKVAGLAGVAAVNLSDSEGANLRLEGADFDPKVTVLFIKLNRSGQIRFRRFAKQGSTWEMTGELRGITKIAVVTDP